MADAAFAQSIDVTKSDGIIDTMKATFDNMSETIGNRARQLLLILFGVDIVLSFGRAAIASEELASVLSRFAMRLLFVGFALFIIQFAPGIINEVTNFSLKIAADGSSGNVTSPSVSGVMADGVRRAGELLGKISLWEVDTYFYIFAAIMTLIVAAITLAMIIVVYAELYLVSLAGLIVMGFAGLEMSKDSAILYIKTIIGKGLKLLGLLLIFTIMTKVTLELADRGTSYNGFENVAMILMMQIITAVMIMTIPNSIESLSGGVGGTAASAIVGAIVGGVAAKVAMGAMGAAAGGAGGAASGAMKGAAGAGGGVAAKLAGAAKGAAMGGGTGAGRYGLAGLSGNVKKKLGEDLSKILQKNKDV